MGLNPANHLLFSYLARSDPTSLEQDGKEERGRIGYVTLMRLWILCNDRELVKILPMIVFQESFDDFLIILFHKGFSDNQLECKEIAGSTPIFQFS